MNPIHSPVRRRRRLLPLAFAAAALFPAAGAVFAAGSSDPDSPDLFPAPVYVTLQAASAVEDLSTGKAWDALDSAHYDAVSPDGTRLLVGSKDRPEVYLVDTASGETLATFEIGPTPQGVAIGPRGKRALAVSAGNGTVAVIDLENLKLLKSIPVGKVPHNARFTANGKLAYVTLQGAGSVAVVDMQALEKIGEIPVPGITGPHNLDLSEDEDMLWVRGLVGKVAAIDIESREVLALIPVGLGHGGIDVIPGGRYVFTGAIADHMVDVIDPETFKVVERIEVGQGPHGVRASRDGRWVYAGITATDKVAVIDTSTLEVARQLPTGGKLPFWISVVGNE